MSLHPDTSSKCLGTCIHNANLFILTCTKMYPPSNQQASTVGSSIVGKTDFDAIMWQFVGIG